MLKSISMILGCLLAQVAIASEQVTFPTISDAQKYCPPLTESQYDLTFTPLNNTVNSAGIVQGLSVQKVDFKSDAVVQPMNWDPKTLIISDAQFRNVNGSYGYISGNNTVCYYSYLSWTGVSVALILSN